MIDTVLFDMGGTLEDIWVDDESRHSSIQGVLDILRMGFGATFHIDSYLTKLKDTNVPVDVKPTYSVKDIYEVYTILKDAR